MRVLSIFLASFVIQAKHGSRRATFWFSLIVQPMLITTVAVALFTIGGRPNLTAFALIGPGLIGMWNANLWSTGFIMQAERRMGTLELLLASPTPVTVVLAGKSLMGALISVSSVGMTLLAGAIVFRVPIGLGSPVDFITVLVASVISVGALGFLISTLFFLSRSAVAVATTLNYPVFILSGLMFPTTLLPAWAVVLSYPLPTTWAHAGLVSVGVGEGSVRAVSYLVALAVIYAIGGSLIYRYAEELGRRRGELSFF